MGKFREPVWLGIDAQDPVVRSCFPHLWAEHEVGDLCEDVAYPHEPITICMHCFVERCLARSTGGRCLLPAGHTARIPHVNDGNHRWPLPTG